MIDNITITIFILLSFLLVWIGIMIFTTKPETEVLEEQTQTNEVTHADNETETYRHTIAELETKIKKMEEKPTNDKLLEWLTDLRRENEFLKMKLTHAEGSKRLYEEDTMKYEDDKLIKDLEAHKLKVDKLEQEVKDLKNSIHYYRDLVSKLQGNYTVLNKLNYRICIRTPETGEYEYQLVKLPHDFDPFNPTYITKEGIEVYEREGLRIPTKLGDIIREEFKKDMYVHDFELDR
jgi:cell division protein FtsB